MKKPLIAFFIAVLVGFVTVFIGKDDQTAKDTEVTQVPESYPQERMIRYRFSVKNQTNDFIESANFWAYAPVEKTSFQKTLSIESSHPYVLKRDELGNQILVFDLKNLPPHGTKLIDVTAKLTFAGTANKRPLSEKGVYLKSEHHIESDNADIIKLANTLRVDSVEKTAKQTFDWVANNIEYAGYIKEDLGALYAMKNRKGDCTEYMHLFTALSRAQRIPTRGIGGYVYASNSLLKPSEYHNWAEVYIDGAWHVVDPQNKKYRQNASDYIAMRVISEIETINLSDSHRFAYSDKRLSVKMH